jgi:hypothetical protein
MLYQTNADSERENICKKAVGDEHTQVGENAADKGRRIARCYVLGMILFRMDCPINVWNHCLTLVESAFSANCVE